MKRGEQNTPDDAAAFAFPDHHEDENAVAVAEQGKSEQSTSPERLFPRKEFRVDSVKESEYNGGVLADDLVDLANWEIEIETRDTELEMEIEREYEKRELDAGDDPRKKEENRQWHQAAFGEMKRQYRNALQEAEVMMNRAEQAFERHLEMIVYGEKTEMTEEEEMSVDSEVKNHIESVRERRLNSGDTNDAEYSLELYRQDIQTIAKWNEDLLRANKESLDRVFALSSPQQQYETNRTYVGIQVKSIERHIETVRDECRRKFERARSEAVFRPSQERERGREDVANNEKEIIDKLREQIAQVE